MIDGGHPFKQAVPGCFVDYSVRTRHGGNVMYFNFALAEEMGLIARGHKRELGKELTKVILDTFSLQIINEYDIIHNTPIPKKDIRPFQYMATRYLQLQHPDKTGQTSGDGRSIWNGCFKGGDATWDISSCGTGVTCLSPATANEKRFFKTGDKNASYGSGRSDLLDGIGTSLMSEILHHNGVRTERTLAIIAFDNGTSINVRTYKNLLRPAHLFLHVKQENHEKLKQVVDYYIVRQVQNKAWPVIKNEVQKYRYLLEQIAMEFARVTARFESDYIFCWMEWDGDNILMDGAIIDYGSLRQFGLFHHEYRYDDVDRMSTTITEQKNKAKYIVQTFAQLVEFLITKKKKNIHNFRNHKSLKLFDRIFEETKDEALLYKMGLNLRERQSLLSDALARVKIRQFGKVFRYFEKAKSHEGPYVISDGVTWDAVFCMRDILRELPRLYQSGVDTIGAEDFIDIIRSDYATDEDVASTPYRRKQIRKFQKLYQVLIEMAATGSRKKVSTVLKEMVDRSALINRYERITGDSILATSKALIKASNKLNSKEFYSMYNDFIEAQILRPEYFSSKGSRRLRHQSSHARKAFHEMLQSVKDLREGI